MEKKQSFQSRVPRNAGRLVDVMLENVERINHRVDTLEPTILV